VALPEQRPGKSFSLRQLAHPNPTRRDAPIATAKADKRMARACRNFDRLIGASRQLAGPTALGPASGASLRKFAQALGSSCGSIEAPGGPQIANI
jgi:hypothetical protein